jgi:tetratricopeptide (TPR) repeat protein
LDPRLAAALLIDGVLPSASNDVRIGHEYRRLGVLDSAHARFARALAKDSRSSEAHEGLARVWRDWGMAERGLGSAYRAIHYDPLSASARNTLGTLLDALGKREEARAAYTRAVDLDPTAGWALNNLCYLDFRLGRLAQAQANCEAALLSDPGLAAAHNNLALTHATAGDLTAAAREFSATGEEGASEYNLGIVFLAQGKYLLAARAFERAIVARPSFTAAKARAHGARLRLLTGGRAAPGY